MYRMKVFITLEHEEKDNDKLLRKAINLCLDLRDQLVENSVATQFKLTDLPRTYARAIRRALDEEV